ncbi:hypothetical protein QEN19_003412 [Hanseniaspora menglaensis]
MSELKVILKLEKTRISNTAVYLMYNAKLPKETTMKRVDDGWINISQCFKLENFAVSKMKRNKILEEEEQAGAITIEKITGGWGRFQGSWISTDDAIYLFKKYSFQNYVNLTLLTFKEDSTNIFPFKQDVKNYEPLTFEFEPSTTNIKVFQNKNEEIKQTKSNQSVIKKNVSAQGAQFKKLNFKEFQVTDDLKKKKKVKSDNTPKTKGVKRLSMQQNTEMKENNRTHNDVIETETKFSPSGVSMNSPYKKLKVTKIKNTSFTANSFNDESNILYSNNDTATPFNSSSKNYRRELSTFKNQYNNNFKDGNWLDIRHNDTNNTYTPSKIESNGAQKTFFMSPAMSQDINTIVYNKTKLTAEKYKELIINALEQDQNDKKIINILYNCTCPENIDANFTIDEEGNTALHWAAAQGNIFLVKYLLEETKSDPFKYNIKGMSCLSKALFFDNNYKNNTFSSLLTLLSNCLVVQDVNGKLPLHYIIELCSSKVKNIKVSIYYLDLMIKFLSIEFDMPYNSEENKEEGQYLKRSFIKVALNCQDIMGNTPLHLAAMNANFDIYNFFITIGGDPVILNSDNQSAYAILQNHYNRIVKKYQPSLQEAAELNSTNNGSNIHHKQSNVYSVAEKENTYFGHTQTDNESDLQALKAVPPILKLEKDNSDMLIEPMDFGLTTISNIDSSSININPRSEAEEINTNSNIFGSVKSQSRYEQSDYQNNEFKRLSSNRLALDSNGTKKGHSMPIPGQLSYNLNMFQLGIDNDISATKKNNLLHKSNKLAPLNLVRLNSSQTILKRSPDPNVIFLPRNRLKNQDMVQSLRKYNAKMNELFESLNEIYAVREEKLSDLEICQEHLNKQQKRLALIHDFYKNEGIYSLPEEVLRFESLDKAFEKIISQWKIVIAKSLKTQLILKSTVDCESETQNIKMENRAGRAEKAQKLKQLMLLERQRKGLAEKMGSVVLDDGGSGVYLKALEKITSDE